ncbi:MAG TPA: sulfatase-like hydrolase/transferase [Desulfomonilaceae bacterium]|nr:sulfatase-like hydrolase/transferase [Desulfomonilaceae bacterium]
MFTHRCNADRDTRNKPLAGLVGVDSGAAQWLTCVLFLIVSSILFASLFEWERYAIIAAPRGRELTQWETGQLFWFISAKSLIWFVPLLPGLAMLILLGLRRSAVIVLNVAWILVFYLMAVDLTTVSFMGNHCWDYLPYLQDIIKHPEQKFWQWAGEALTVQALLILLIFIVSGPACYLSVSWVTRHCVKKYPRICAKESVVGVTTLCALAVVGLLPVLATFQDRNLLDRLYSAMPLTSSLRESLQNRMEDLTAWLQEPSANLITAGLCAIAPPKLTLLAQPYASLENPLEYRTYPQREFTLEDGLFQVRKKPGLSLISRSGALGQWFHGNLKVNVARTALGSDGHAWSQWPDMDPSAEETSSDVRAVHIDQQEELAALGYLKEAADPGPMDTSAFVKRDGLPNVIMLIFESFRDSSLSPACMTQLDSWAEQGLRLQRHYSGSNCSHLGLFSLFYGRTALGFHRTLDRSVPAQMLESLRRSGYRISFITSGEIQGFRRIQQFINEDSCDDVIMEGQEGVKSMSDWPQSDRRKLACARDIVNRGDNRPQFVFFYLLSSHYRYPCPPEFETFKESSSVWQFFNPRAQIRNHLGRYGNSLKFLEHEVMNFIRSIDPKRNVVMITGDHGESMGEDGVFIHASRMSDVQLRVPFVMVGPGIESRKIRTATVHTDILPTLLHALAGRAVPIKHCQGRDLIGDPAPRDEIAVTRPKWPEWDGLMYIRGDRRMLFKANIAPREPLPSIEFAGLLDQWGQYEIKLDPGTRRVLTLHP